MGPVHNDHKGRNIDDCFGQWIKHSAAHALMLCASDCCTGSGHICCESNAQHVSSATDDVLQESHSASINGSICHPELMMVYWRC